MSNNGVIFFKDAIRQYTDGKDSDVSTLQTAVDSGLICAAGGCSNQLLELSHVEEFYALAKEGKKKMLRKAETPDWEPADASVVAASATALEARKWKYLSTENLRHAGANKGKVANVSRYKYKNMLMLKAWNVGKDGNVVVDDIISERLFGDILNTNWSIDYRDALDRINQVTNKVGGMRLIRLATRRGWITANNLYRRGHSIGLPFKVLSVKFAENSFNQLIEELDSLPRTTDFFDYLSKPPVLPDENGDFFGYPILPFGNQMPEYAVSYGMPVDRSRLVIRKRSEFTKIRSKRPAKAKRTRVLEATATKNSDPGQPMIEANVNIKSRARILRDLKNMAERLSNAVLYEQYSKEVDRFIEEIAN